MFVVATSYLLLLIQRDTKELQTTSEKNKKIYKKIESLSNFVNSQSKSK